MRLLLPIGFLLFVVGCGGGGPSLVDVSGTVTMDGKPLDQGEIIFESLDGSVGPGAGPITDGKYAVKVPKGSKKVKILSSRAGAKVDPVMGSAPLESRIGPEYNDRTTLKVDIQGNQTDVNFQVKELKR
jgi:hypothetical protein